LDVNTLLEKLKHNNLLLGDLISYLEKQSRAKDTGEYDYPIHVLRKVQGFLAYLEKEAKALLEEEIR